MGLMVGVAPKDSHLEMISHATSPYRRAVVFHATRSDVWSYNALVGSLNERIVKCNFKP